MQRSTFPAKSRVRRRFWIESESLPGRVPQVRAQFLGANLGSETLSPFPSVAACSRSLAVHCDSISILPLLRRQVVEKAASQARLSVRASQDYDPNTLNLRKTLDHSGHCARNIL